MLQAQPGTGAPGTHAHRDGVLGQRRKQILVRAVIARREQQRAARHVGQHLADDGALVHAAYAHLQHLVAVQQLGLWAQRLAQLRAQRAQPRLRQVGIGAAVVERDRRDLDLHARARRAVRVRAHDLLAALQKAWREVGGHAPAAVLVARAEAVLHV